MMNDVRCPYCQEWQDINHDDGFGYEEDVLHEQECSKCEKIFTFYTYIIFSYESFKADCLNDGEHELEKVEGHHYHPDWVRCKTCEYENKGELDREQLDRDTIQWDKQV